LRSNLGNPQAENQKLALDWVTKNAGKGKWAHIDASRLAVGGQSCGGLEAYGDLLISVNNRLESVIC
jgi:hypothetical protein